MDFPTPSFQDIIQYNKLIKGRLRTPVKALEKLHRVLLKENARINKQMDRENKHIRSHLKKRSQLNLLLKRNTESILKSFYPATDKISLLYKKQGTSTYIKARLYWEGIQREVQIGTIPRVTDMINTLIENKVITDLKPIENTKLNWKSLNDNPQVLQAVKEVAALKFQEYLLRKLLTSSDLDESEMIFEATETVAPQMDDKNKPTPSHREPETDELPENGTDWYIQWRENNL
ncbi:MAG: hypothetical protein QGF36_06045 [Candidatus Marinimicrobia bacterium]|jgi:hypothetical protein|nr:hypothetical protein [Candidatus Neomarinimicrobiota bacterium]